MCLDCGHHWATSMEMLRSQAAEQGDVDAQVNLGYAYATGRGVPQDYATAHMWYNLASSNGNALGSKNRDQIAEQMTPADISEAQRRARVCLESQYKECD
jgi:TPR repeat protein